MELSKHWFLVIAFLQGKQTATVQKFKLGKKLRRSYDS
jgi:hypothetical protein